MTHERRARLVVMLKAASQESEAHFANRTARTNKVQGHFCRREWFGESKVDVRAFLDVYVWGSYGKRMCLLQRPDSRPNNQIWCRDVRLRYFPSASPGALCGSTCLYIFKYSMNSSLTSSRARLCAVVVISVQVDFPWKNKKKKVLVETEFDTAGTNPTRVVGKTLNVLALTFTSLTDKSRHCGTRTANYLWSKSYI